MLILIIISNILTGIAQACLLSASSIINIKFKYGLTKLGRVLDAIAKVIVGGYAGAIGCIFWCGMVVLKDKKKLRLIHLVSALVMQYVTARLLNEGFIQTLFAIACSTIGAITLYIAKSSRAFNIENIIKYPFNLVYRLMIFDYVGFTMSTIKFISSIICEVRIYKKQKNKIEIDIYMG